MLHAEIYHGYDANERIIMDILSPNRKDEILEIGVGTDACAKQIAPLVKRYVGIDIALRTNEALKEHNMSHNIEFHCFDMCDEIIPSELRTGSTKVYSFDTIKHIECPQRLEILNYYLGTSADVKVELMESIPRTSGAKERLIVKNSRS